TLLSKGGVAPRTAQSAMRHSSIDLTMTVYTDPKLLDVRGALDSLPSLPITGDDRKRLPATGTGEGSPRQFAPGFAPAAENHGETLSQTVKSGGRGERQRTAVSEELVKRNDSLTVLVSESSRAGDGIRTHDVQLGKLACNCFGLECQ